MPPSNQNSQYYAYSNSTLPAKPNNRRRLLLIVGGVLIAFIIVLAFLSTLSSSNTEGFARSFVATINNEPAESSYALLSADAKQTISPIGWESFVEKNRPFLAGNINVAYTSDVDEAGGKEYGLNIGEPGKTYRATVVVVESSDGLKVYSIKINPTML